MKKFYRLAWCLIIFYIIFISLFALDVFENAGWFWALVIHLIPSMVLVVISIIAWKKRRVGGVLFLLAGLIMAVFFHSFWLALPVLVVGLIFAF